MYNCCCGRRDDFGTVATGSEALLWMVGWMLGGEADGSDVDDVSSKHGWLLIDDGVEFSVAVTDVEIAERGLFLILVVVVVVVWMKKLRIDVWFVSSRCG